MKEIIFTDPHRQKHFDFFRQMDQPHFNVCAPVDISSLLPWIQSKERSFTATIVYCLARIANEIPEFRRRIRGTTVWEYEQVHPSYTIDTPVSDVFSFCYVPFLHDYQRFMKGAKEQSERIKSQPVFEDEQGRDDLLFLSAFPWVSFTSVMHAMHYSPVDSVPRIAWGKYYREQNQIKMPLAVQAHHAIVDGRHVGLFFQLLQELFDQPDSILEKATW